MKRLATCAVIRNSKGEYLVGVCRKTGLYCLPGGKMEAGETLEQCLKREVREECGIEVNNVALLDVREDPRPEANYVCVYYLFVTEQQPLNMEPHLFTDWRWIDTDNLPDICKFFTREVILKAEASRLV